MLPICRSFPLFLLPVASILLVAPTPAQDTAIDLTAPNAAETWALDGERARIADGELILDGRTAMSRAFYLPQEWQDVSLKAQFMVEPQAHGVLACGFVVRAADASHYYYVHYDKGQAILCRSDKGQSWNEIKRVSGLDRPAGAWHEGRLDCEGDTLRVYLNGDLLYEAKDATLGRAGRVGFYANQGIAHVKDIVVSGKPAPAKRDFSLPAPPPKDFAYVCTDAGAGGYEAFPDVCRLDDGRLMCVFYAGYGHVALPNPDLPKGGRIAYCLSSDEGRTWTEPKTLYDGPDDDRDPSIVQTDSGRLICNFFSLRKAELQDPPWTGLGTWMVYSDDLGQTWSEPRQITGEYYCSSPIRQLSDGRLVLGLYKETDGVSHGAVVFSDDDGMTWGEIVDIDNNGMPLDAETDIIELEDGTLHAAQRSAGDSMAWSESTDGGKTWSVSQPYGFPGHAPYLHRTLNDVILLAHRLPNTSLHYSLDEANTWSDSVLVDNHNGAYPSMVNLKDGSVLIVYYEEGEGSNIRAKRFLANDKGLHFRPVDQGVVPGATVVSYKKIWDEAPHNAFTNLIRYKGEWFCVFREGQGHVSADGALRVITSKDGETWTSAARITSDTADLRDAQICITPDNRLMLTGAAALHQPAEARHQTMAYFSEDGRNWTEGAPIGEKDLWLWRVTWHEDTAYGIGYTTGDQWPYRFTRLYKSDDGTDFEVLVEELRHDEYSNESQIVFTEDDTAYCLLRRDEKAPKSTEGLLGTARPPYTNWTWKEVGMKIGGPAMMQLPDGRFVAAVRLYDGKVRTGLCWVDTETGKLTEFLALPSGGDTSYPGLVWHDGLLWVSYYASHAGKTSIYLAKVRLDE